MAPAPPKGSRSGCVAAIALAALLCLAALAVPRHGPAGGALSEHTQSELPPAAAPLLSPASHSRGTASPHAPSPPLAAPAAPPQTARAQTPRWAPPGSEWILPDASTYSVAHPSTPMPQPGDNITIVMHSYADWIMCTKWTLPEYGRRLGFHVLIASWPKPPRRPGQYYVWIDLEEPSLVGSRIRQHRDRAEGLTVLREYEAQWDHVLTLCPYTAAWVNRHMGQHRRTAIYYPFHRATAKYKSRWVRHHTTVGMAAMKQAQDSAELPHPAIGADLTRKLRIISSARIAVVYNAMFDYPFLHLYRSPIATMAAIRARPLLLSNYAFAYNSQYNASQYNASRFPYPLSPQFKSRMIEAAACGAVMLVFNDGYNVIEQYFEPGVDFVYWTDLDDFHVKVRTVLADPATYEAMARRARDKALRQYNTDTFVQDYIVPFLKARDGR